MTLTRYIAMALCILYATACSQSSLDARYVQDVFEAHKGDLLEIRKMVQEFPATTKRIVTLPESGELWIDSSGRGPDGNLVRSPARQTHPVLWELMTRATVFSVSIHDGGLSFQILDVTLSGISVLVEIIEWPMPASTQNCADVEFLADDETGCGVPLESPFWGLYVWFAVEF